MGRARALARACRPRPHQTVHTHTLLPSLPPRFPHPQNIARPPPGQFVQISLSPELGCGVTFAGELKCWGVTNTPAGKFLT